MPNGPFARRETARAGGARLTLPIWERSVAVASKIERYDRRQYVTQLVSEVYQHVPHPRTKARMAGTAPPPPKVDDQRVGVNGKLGLMITTIVGTMWAAYIFTILALISLPSAINSGDTIIIIAWIAQTFLQLVLLPIIIVGQNIQGKAADKRSEETYNDAEAVLHECLQIQEHLSAQDKAQQEQIEELKQLLAQLRGTPPASAQA